MIASELKCSLEKHNIRYELNYDLSKASSFRVGGSAEIALFPNNEEELSITISLLRDNQKRYEIVGNGSNILFADGELDLAIIFTSRLSHYSFSNSFLKCEAGVSLTAVAKKAADAGLSGLEFAYGIPGTVGGAVYMNAGAYGSCVSEILTSSRVLDAGSGDIFTLSANAHKFDYRRSIFMSNEKWICLGAEFSLKPDNTDSIYARMNDYISSRKEKQPLEYPSAGSYFKRPVGYFAGKLIEDCGLKGFRVGDAAISEKHAGFVINLGRATASDILFLEEQVRERVFKTFGVELEREVRVIK